MYVFEKVCKKAAFPIPSKSFLCNCRKMHIDPFVHTVHIVILCIGVQIWQVQQGCTHCAYIFAALNNKGSLQLLLIYSLRGQWMAISQGLGLEQDVYSFLCFCSRFSFQSSAGSNYIAIHFSF